MTLVATSTDLTNGYPLESHISCTLRFAGIVLVEIEILVGLR